MGERGGVSVVAFDMLWTLIVAAAAAKAAAVYG